MGNPLSASEPARFLEQASLEEVQSLLAERLGPLATETIELPEACGRVLGGDIASSYAIPLFDRAAMDGFAVRSADLADANATSPMRLSIVGQALPNRPFVGELLTGQSLAITTGAPLPNGADAVVQQENVNVETKTITCREPLAIGQNVSRRGEDIQAGESVLSAGRVLRPQDLGVLASIGVARVSVVKQPRVSILVTGNEILPQGSRPTGYQIVDSSSIMLRSLVAHDGGLAERPIYIPDRPEAIRAALLAASGDSVLVTGGTSVGVEDFAPRVLQEIGELCVHGMHMRPARPIGIGFLQSRPVFLLPGNPFSCLCAYDLVVRLAIQRLGGRPWEFPYHRVHLTTGALLSGAEGRWDYVRVLIRDGRVIPFLKGRGSGASVLSSAVRADGFVLIPPSQADVARDAPIEVYLYDTLGTLPLTA